MNKGLWISTLFVFVLSLLAAGCSATVQTVPPKSRTDVINELDSSTAGLVLRHDDSVYVYCTAVWVSEKTLLTANHCVEAAMESWVEDHTKKSDSDDEDEDAAPPPSPKLKEFNFYYMVKGEVAGLEKEPTGTHLARVAYADKKHDLALLKA